MNKNRPVNLDLMSLKFPPMAIVSILHRISGVLLFLLFPALLYCLSGSLRSHASFQQVKSLLESPFNRAVLWIFLAALSFHVLAGIRHIIMDMGYAEGLTAGRNTAIFVLVLTIVLTLFIGVQLW